MRLKTVPAGPVTLDEEAEPDVADFGSVQKEDAKAETAFSGLDSASVRFKPAAETDMNRAYLRSQRQQADYARQLSGPQQPIVVRFYQGLSALGIDGNKLRLQRTLRTLRGYHEELTRVDVSLESLVDTLVEEKARAEANASSSIELMDEMKEKCDYLAEQKHKRREQVKSLVDRKVKDRDQAAQIRQDLSLIDRDIAKAVNSYNRARQRAVQECNRYETISQVYAKKLSDWQQVANALLDVSDKTSLIESLDLGSGDTQGYLKVMAQSQQFCARVEETLARVRDPAVLSIDYRVDSIVRNAIKDVPTDTPHIEEDHVSRSLHEWYNGVR